MTQQAFAQVNKQAQVQKPQASISLERECNNCRKKKRKSEADLDSEKIQSIMDGALHSPATPPVSSRQSYTGKSFGYDFNQIPVHSRLQGRIQAKLTVNATGDIYEQEADRIADQVMATQAHHAVSGASPHIQCFAGQPAGQADAAPTSVNRVLASPGRPLEPTLRQDMEERFGHDFSGVRVHSGSDAEQSAREVNASAYTLGQNIVFGAGRFAPTTSEGQWLLAHELTHVMQQSAATKLRLQRKMDDSELAKCRRYQKGAVEPCSRLSKEDLTRKIPAYDEKKHGIASPLFQPFLAIAIEPVSAHARFRLFRAVSCPLSPSDAVLVRDNFVSGIGRMSEAFDKLSNEDRCDLITLIDARIDSGAKAEAVRIARDIRNEQRFNEAARQWAEAEERERRKRQLTPEQQWARDKELHAKAGRTTWVDVLFPSAIKHYRIQYAWQIKDPVLKQSASLAERGATISIAAAAADPIMRPIKAVIRFFECLISSIKGGKLYGLSSRFGLKFAASFTVSFGPGVIVGATKEIAAIAKQIAHIIAHPIKFVEDLWGFLKLLWSPNSDEIACAMGQDMGKAATAETANLAKLSDLELPYRLGEIAGPLILNTLIAIVAPEVVGALASTRIGKKLLGLLEALGDELKFLDKWRKRGKGAVKVEKDVAKAGRIEEVVGDAGKFVTEHKLGAVEEAANGLRHAKVGDTGHEVVEVLDAASPTGIACELQSPRPHRRVVCPPNMGSRKETIEEYKARGGKVQEVAPGPTPKVTESEKVVIQDPRKTAKQAGVGLAEDHHIATKYRSENKNIFKDLKMSIDDDLNLIVDFEEHGQLRGWYDWDKRGYKKYYMKGHHKEYNAWVTKLLQDASPKGIPPDKALERVRKVLQTLKTLVKENPELLSHGPDISPKFRNLKIQFD